MCEVHGDAALSEATCRDWFRHFKNGDFDVDDRPREGRSKTFEDAELEALLDEDPCQTQEELALALGVTRQAISKRLLTLGMIRKQGTWVPYESHGVCPVMLLHYRLGRIFTLRRLCCVFGGTRSVLFIMSC